MQNRNASTATHEIQNAAELCVLPFSCPLLGLCLCVQLEIGVQEHDSERTDCFPSLTGRVSPIYGARVLVQKKPSVPRLLIALVLNSHLINPLSKEMREQRNHGLIGVGG